MFFVTRFLALRIVLVQPFADLIFVFGALGLALRHIGTGHSRCAGARWKPWSARVNIRLRSNLGKVVLQSFGAAGLEDSRPESLQARKRVVANPT